MMASDDQRAICETVCPSLSFPALILADNAQSDGHDVFEWLFVAAELVMKEFVGDSRLDAQN